MLSRSIYQLHPQLLRLGVRIHARHISNFRIIEHIARTSHSRQRPAGAEPGQDSQLRLHAKQYIPLNNPYPKSGDVSIVGATGNGFPKELQEPLWDDLCESLESQGRKIRSIWIADMASQGRSGIMNEGLIGPDRKHLASTVCP